MTPATGTAERRNERTGQPEIAEIARLILSVSAYGILAISLTALVGSLWSGSAQFLETSRLIFNALLPLLGTWVGTVLAYYFSRKNFESASESVERMVSLTAEQKLSQLSVEKEMLRIGQITAHQIPGGKTAKDVLLVDLRGKFGGKITRLPILDEKGAVLYVIHQSMLFRFLADMSIAAPPRDPRAVTLQELVDDAETKSYVTNIVFGPMKTTVAEAKRKMEQQVGCQDLVVTEHGQKDEPMLGWITNVDIGRLSKA